MHREIIPDEIKFPDGPQRVEDFHRSILELDAASPLRGKVWGMAYRNPVISIIHAGPNEDWTQLTHEGGIIEPLTPSIAAKAATLPINPEVSGMIFARFHPQPAGILSIICRKAGADEPPRSMAEALVGRLGKPLFWTQHISARGEMRDEQIFYRAEPHLAGVATLTHTIEDVAEANHTNRGKKPDSWTPLVAPGLFMRRCQENWDITKVIQEELKDFEV